MGRLLVICGPTATGKTSLAIKLAKKFSSRGRSALGWNGEIISADSRQVYKGMDIGTGKDHPKEMKIHLVDVVKPNQEFSVAQYVDLAWKVIHNIWKKKKLPIIVGGTGFYIKGVIDGIETLGISPDWGLRWRLKDLPAQKLFEMLAQLDSEKVARMNASDRKNPRRLIRAIEVASKQQTAGSKQLDTGPCKLDALFIGLKAPYKTLYQRIDQRVEDRVRMGQEAEIKRLLKKGYGWQNSALGVTIGYREWQPFFEGKETKKAVIQRWKFIEHAYVRRQMTWFKRALRQVSTPSSTRGVQDHWFDITKKGWADEVEKLISSWYTEKRYGQKN